MPVCQTLAIEAMALRELSELDQLEHGHLWCMNSGDPKTVATGIRLLGHHLQLTRRDLQMAMVISEAELALTTAPLSIGMSTGP